MPLVPPEGIVVAVPDRSVPDDPLIPVLELPPVLPVPPIFPLPPALLPPVFPLLRPAPVTPLPLAPDPLPLLPFPEVPFRSSHPSSEMLPTATMHAKAELAILCLNMMSPHE